VEFGLTTSYGGLTQNANLVTGHQITLTGLVPRARYHYRVKSRDAAGNLAVSRDFTFKTAASRGITTRRAVIRPLERERRLNAVSWLRDR
jgi:hypothetical protein